jgi:hypothetical protein
VADLYPAHPGSPAIGPIQSGFVSIDAGKGLAIDICVMWRGRLQKLSKHKVVRMHYQSIVSMLETGTVEIMTSKAFVVDYLITQLEIPQ